MNPENLYPNFTPISPSSFFERLRNEFGCTIGSHAAKYPDSQRYTITRIRPDKTNIHFMTLKDNCRELQSHPVRSACRSLDIDTNLFGINS